jgi:hypothetical protein
MKIPELETALREAQERASRAAKALAPKHRGSEVEEFRAARDAVLQAERNLAAPKGEPYAVPVHFPVSWDTGARLPYLLQTIAGHSSHFSCRILIQTGTDRTCRCGTLINCATSSNSYVRMA